MKMSVEDVKSNNKGVTRLQKFKKRICEALHSLSCCIPIGEQQRALVKEVASKISAEVAVPGQSGEIYETNKGAPIDDNKSLDKSEDDVADIAVELAIKASLSLAMDHQL